MSEPKTLFRLNGHDVAVSPRPAERLSQTLRDRLGALDVKIGCDAGDCGACTVLVDGAPICACLTATAQVAGRTVETLQGLLTSEPQAAALAQRFQDHGAAQCGICTPGMMVAAVPLLRDTPRPSEEQVKDALGGVLCRCTGYRKIIDAVMDAPAPTVTGTDGASGTAIRRLDGAGKVAGTERFGDDVAPAGALVVRLIGCPYPRAGFTFGDLDAVRAWPGVNAVLTVADIPGLNAHGVIPGFQDQPVFADTIARYRGEPVAAVVGDPDAMAVLDLEAFPVEWTPLEDVTDPRRAMEDGQPILHHAHPNNIMCTGFVAHGDADAALARADVTVTGHYSSGFVEHAYIEPEAGFAQMVGDRVEIYTSTQAPVMDLESLAPILGLERHQIRIVPTGVGGGFGSKLDLSIQPYLALAAMVTGAPVRLTYSRSQSMQMTTKRHPSDMHVTIGATRDGRINGFRFDGVFNTGAYASWGPTVSNRVPVHASGPYRVADYRAEAIGVYTNAPPSGAFRGFGVPQAAIAQECLFDELANTLGMDRLEFRILNALENGMPTVCGQVFDQGVGIKPCLEALRPAWDEERTETTAFNSTNTVLKRGVGVAAGWYGCGNTSLPNPSTIKSGITASGALYLHQGAMDIGQGANTVIAQLFATALGVTVEAVNLIGPDTDVTPDAGKTSASRQTFVSGNAARLSGAALRALILGRVNAGADAVVTLGAGVIDIRDGDVTHQIALNDLTPDAEGYVLRAEETYNPPTKPLDANGQGHPYAQFGYAAHLVVVEVDTGLGTVRPIKFVAAHDVGHAVNPMLVEGQVHGGIAQGLGMALMEEYIPGRTENLHDYLIPTIGDIPPIETLIIEEPDAHGPYGAKGLGEHVLIPTAPALLNAIHDATGARITRVPATPARVRAAILEVPNAG
jgi:aldehyde oxidoreductase